MKTPFDPSCPATPPQADASPPDKRALLRHAIAVLAGAAGSASGATIVYLDGSTHYITRGTADAMTGRAPTRWQA